jgi:hypothetical protein
MIMMIIGMSAITIGIVVVKRRLIGTLREDDPSYAQPPLLQGVGG